MKFSNPSSSSVSQWRLAIWPAILAGLIFLASAQSRTVGPPGIPFLDKIVHFSIYGLFATLLARVFFHPDRKWRSIAVTVAIVSLYGVSDEFHQSFTPGRSVEVADWLADTLGAGIAAAVYGFWPAYRRALETRVRRRFENRDRAAASSVAAARTAMSGRTVK